jgi:hypothetical protein
LHKKIEPKETDRSDVLFEKESIMKESRYKNYMREERVKGKLKKDDPYKQWESNMQKYQGAEKVQ